MIPEQTEWKVGDWCFYNYTLCVVTRMAPDGRVTGLDDGADRFTGDHPDRRVGMFPLSIRGKYISAHYTDQRNRLRVKPLAVSWALIETWLSERWVAVMSKDGDDWLQELGTFVHHVRRISEEATKLADMGLKVFQPLNI
jgi:hypothetical protein